MQLHTLLTLILIVGILTGAQSVRAQAPTAAPPETPVIPIALAGPAAAPDAELSGMAWYGNTLILMPENADRFAENGSAGALFALERDAILDYLTAAIDGTEPAPLIPRAIPLESDDLRANIPGMDGFEAIAVAGDRIFLAVESVNGDGTMRGDLIPGTLAPDASAITLDLDQRISVAAQSTFPNMSYESLLVVDDVVWMFYEINGSAVNAEPVGYGFGVEDLAPAGTVPLASLEYRLTDMTALDDANRFWAVNYFFPGEDFLLPETDPIADTYGEGETHAAADGIERLVEMELTPDGIILADRAPIQLALLPDDLRNWEGIVRLGDLGFLLVTDKYPETVLGFVPLPPEEG